MNKEILEIIAEVAEVPVRKIELDSSLTADLGLESLDLVTLVTEFENKFNVTVDDKDIKNLQTVGDVVSYIEKHV